MNALITAAQGVLAYLTAEREGLMKSYCLLDSLGTPIRDTASGADHADLLDIEAQIDALAKGLISAGAVSP